MSQFSQQIVIYFCKKCGMLKKGTLDEDVGLFWNHQDINTNKRCFLQNQYTFTNAIGGKDVHLFVMGPK